MSPSAAPGFSSIQNTQGTAENDDTSASDNYAWLLLLFAPLICAVAFRRRKRRKDAVQSIGENLKAAPRSESACIEHAAPTALNPAAAGFEHFNEEDSPESLNNHGPPVITPSPVAIVEVQKHSVDGASTGLGRLGKALRRSVKSMKAVFHSRGSADLTGPDEFIEPVVLTALDNHEYVTDVPLAEVQPQSGMEASFVSEVAINDTVDQVQAVFGTTTTDELPKNTPTNRNSAIFSASRGLNLGAAQPHFTIVEVSHEDDM